MEYLIVVLAIIVVLSVVVIVFKPFQRVEKEQCMHLWGDVSDGWQYCSKCGLARVAGCVHEWKEVSNHNITRSTDNGVIGNEIHYVCKKCTQGKYVRTSLNEDPVVKLI